MPSKIQALLTHSPTSESAATPSDFVRLSAPLRYQLPVLGLRAPAADLEATALLEAGGAVGGGCGPKGRLREEQGC
jgi:hypothetical protein